MNLREASNFTDRYISWLQFNERVLEEAYDDSNPLFEKLKFLAITSSNLDEFTMIKYSEIKCKVDMGIISKNNKSGNTPRETLDLIIPRINNFIDKQDIIYNKYIKQLKKHDIHLKKISDLEISDYKKIKKYFNDFVFPLLTPVVVNSYLPFPTLNNLRLNIVAKLSDTSGKCCYGIIRISSNIERLIEMDEGTFILLEDVIKEFLDICFEGYNVIASSCFRITKNADIEYDEDGEIDNYYESITKDLKQRNKGVIVRLEIESSVNDDVLYFLKDNFKLGDIGVYFISTYLDYKFLFKFVSKIEHLNKKLSFKKFAPKKLKYFNKTQSMIELLRKKDLLLYHPFDSYEPIIRLIDEASKDKNVLAIKQTLYRVSNSSPIIYALIEAAERGKHVVIVMELKARFDEENNLGWAKKLEEAGVTIIYGMPELKTHSKMLLIVRKANKSIETFVHVGTGNYNDDTAKLYTDYSFMTSKKKYGSDAITFFNRISSFHGNVKYNHIVTSPQDIRDDIISHISNEIISHKKYGDGRIIFKVNGITDYEVIIKLYEASIAGVKIDLIVRGICCLIPQKEGISENIHVTSIVGKYLEHSRVFYFKNNTEDKIYISSADLMTRNLSRRIEVAAPINDRRLKKKILKHLDYYLKDDTKSRINIKGQYYKKEGNTFNSQYMLEKL